MKVSHLGSRWRRYFLLPLLLLGTLILLVCNGGWLLAEGYGVFAREGVRHERLDASTLMAAGLAVRLSPFSADARALQGWLLARDVNPAGGLAAYRQALRHAPADPTLWQSFVHVKLVLGQFDAELEHAMQRVRTLAPRVLALHEDNAYLAMQYWHWATPSMRSFWVDSVRYTLDFDSKYFLKLVLLSRKEDVLCLEPEFHRPNTQWWCKFALQAREACFAPVPRKAVLGWCRSIGFVRDPLK